MSALHPDLRVLCMLHLCQYNIYFLNWIRDAEFNIPKAQLINVCLVKWFYEEVTTTIIGICNRRSAELFSQNAYRMELGSIVGKGKCNGKFVFWPRIPFFYITCPDRPAPGLFYAHILCFLVVQNNGQYMLYFGQSKQDQIFFIRANFKYRGDGWIGCVLLAFEFAQQYKSVTSCFWCKAHLHLAYWLCNYQLMASNFLLHIFFFPLWSYMTKKPLIKARLHGARKIEWLSISPMLSCVFLSHQ